MKDLKSFRKGGKEQVLHAKKHYNGGLMVVTKLYTNL